MGIPEEDARHFDAGFQAGGTLVTVNAGARAEEARECLYESGADLGSLGRGTVRREEARIEQTGGTRIREDSESWRGNERRYGQDSSYNGPERRVAQV
jgi:hypothetical protein